jgi:hypothetical protein
VELVLSHNVSLSKLFSMCISEHLPQCPATIIACLLWSLLSYHPCWLKLRRGRDAATAAGQKAVMDGRADGARHALCPLWPLSLACRTAVGQAFSPDISNHDSRLTVAPKAGVLVECPRGWAGRTWRPWPSTLPFISSAPVVSTVLKSSGARPFPSLLHRPAALPAACPLMSSVPATSNVPENSCARLYLSPPEAWPLMSSAPATPTIPESSGARPFPSLLDRLAVLPAGRPLMSSAPAVLTVPKSSWHHRSYPYSKGQRCCHPLSH